MALSTNRYDILDMSGIIAVVVMVLGGGFATANARKVTSGRHYSSPNQIFNMLMRPDFFWIGCTPFLVSLFTNCFATWCIPVVFQVGFLIGFVVFSLSITSLRRFPAFCSPINPASFIVTIFAKIAKAIGLGTIAVKLAKRFALLTFGATFEDNGLSHSRTSDTGLRWLEPPVGHVPIRGSFILASLAGGVNA